ncbi:TonB-dependent receptor plug domain-containing protein [Chryseobacterium jejuense]|uniref:Iron complex outermembrane recepter protein n=1 Tax=Chryseobacterium jejuense TaxID=445960 RepID=A0A2X2ZBF8_CHRJE|nr:TonB-dependent receptor [Chryseobacterium jejuense]SDI55926.1 iron complex outermembrane recepter protein [Chryseobacterium jejuense]SQB47029.1 Outer membrane cobalamin receptor protein [Chryseobacterium jejuense]
MKQFGIILMFLGVVMNAQNRKTRKDSITLLEKVEVKGSKKKMGTDMKMSVSVDEFLASSDKISFIKRGAYAWEPLLNNMSTERSVVTIDGMRIFGACTDKMDPVTSYLESNTLSSIDIKSGQEGSSHGATVAGSIDLKRKSTPFGLEKKWNGAYQTGFEFNNKQFFNLGNISYSGKKLVVDGSISFRKAQNYYDGNDAEVNHSQYNKFNTGIGIAYKTSPLSSVRIDAIFDMAKNVGFPALPMDLWLSRAMITSASYKQLFNEGLIKSWDTKIYYNTIEHYMDDTRRPENLVHMDMPGWSTTYGLVSSVNLKKERYSSAIELNMYNNTSIAEMRMYPQDRKNRTMFAYSWPWVTTRFAGLSMNNNWEISDKSNVSFGGSLGLNYNESKYAEFNWIFHPGAPQQKTRILPSLHAGYQFTENHFSFSVGTGYGHRAPSVSEGYGYYIYNSFDRYDYIGNPNLKNEISYETNASVGFKNEKMSIEAKVNYFYIQNYIIGKILSLGSPMNYQSVGVKAYTSLDHATLFNMALNAGYSFLPELHWKGTLTYARGRDDKGKNLPFIRPLSYLTSLHFTHQNLGIQTSVNGDFIQRNYSPEYGEDKTPAYAVWNFSVNYTFNIQKLKTVFQVGAENLLNKYYSTYADWGNIPRMGRNIYTSLQFNF